ncbi:DNA polymerase III, delta prime subunit [Sulfurimonas denitrificans DSM 1251]|jgi:DNA polymerase-3 subunit delta'|uniref:DNA polymerase III, delta prime subunit n=1 Tax=Sulfurimonas denitrificans (strain ATCC 33889 / DSM 1251) TaxID=326298 RepID=Q30Q06_SULDN|nr:DNA polymerase III subunit delta' [Sulfurimonas denitrificans]ABB44925.1 DNA polymerase III, delta prime subunit [Sulfurimonas denitrificans DSM 1251]MDD3442673.1 DNA polymerase III subunit delta' [Sulfurimonas denitrificans]
MLEPDSIKSHIIITSDIAAEFERLNDELKPKRVVGFIVEDEFKIEHAKAAVAEAYISESETKYIILGANNFNTVSQNSLLKALEEPPRNIEFIILSNSTSNLLPTVRSRLPIFKGKKEHKVYEIDFSLMRINYNDIFEFLKKVVKFKKSEAKEQVEALYYRATVIDKLILTKAQLDNFDRAFRLLDLNARPQSVFALLLMSFAGDRNGS